MTGKTFEAEVLQSAKTVLVDYWAEWCGPCKMIAPIQEAIAEERGALPSLLYQAATRLTGRAWLSLIRLASVIHDRLVAVPDGVDEPHDVRVR